MRQLPQDSLVLRIEKPIYGGAGLARDDGKAVFIPYTLPGELVSATVTHAKASFAEAAVDVILEPSPQRVQAPCPYFGRCGGCHYQHANYPAQLAIKRTILEETLTRARLSPHPAIVTHAGDAFGYRNRIRLHLALFADTAGAALGYRERGSHRLITIDQCPIAAPELEQALGAIAEVCVEQQCNVCFSQVELSVNQDGSELLLALWLRTAAHLEHASERLHTLCEALQAKLPKLSGACVHAPAAADSDVPGRASRQAGRRPQKRERLQQTADEPGADSEPGMPVARWGATSMNYAVAGIDYRVSLGSFFQVNRTLLETLVQLATGGRRGTLAWDLYAGVGLFSRVLTQSFDEVVAVEGAPISAQDLGFHLAEPHRAIRSSTVEFLRRAARETQKRGALPSVATPDFVLVDPPRSGLGEEVVKLLAQIGPPEITYVSCDPATLSRDLHALVDLGYNLEQMHLIDLFPQTFHLETVAMLSRR